MKKETNLLKRVMVGVSAGCILGLGIFAYNHYISKEPHSQITDETKNSLLFTELGNVSSNLKPKDIFATFDSENRFSRLDDDGKKQAVELLYTSVANASLYYNNIVSVLSGELDYHSENNNALDGQKNSYLVRGLIEDIKYNSLAVNNLSSERILVLPDFEKLYKYTEKINQEDLKIFVESAKRTQELNVFNTDGHISHYKAALAHQILTEGTAKIAEKDPKSPYLDDIASLARIYHDVALGYVYMNGFTLEGDKYKIDDRIIKEWKSIANGSSVLSEFAKKQIEKITDDSYIPASVLKEGSQETLKIYGSNVFWQSEKDIEAIVGNELQQKVLDVKAGEKVSE